MMPCTPRRSEPPDTQTEKRGGAQKTPEPAQRQPPPIEDLGRSGGDSERAASAAQASCAERGPEVATKAPSLT